MADPIIVFSPAEAADPILRIEQYLISALMMNTARTLPLVPAAFSTEHYLDPENRAIHEAVASIGAGVPDLLLRVIGSTGADEKYIRSLVGACPTWTATGQYANAVTEAHHRRGLTAIAENMLAEVRSGTNDAPAAGIAMQALAALDAQLSMTDLHRPGMTLNEAMDAAIEHAEKAARGDVGLMCSTGMASIDAVLGPLEPKEFRILAARPAVGKTALGVQFAVNVARQCRAAGAGCVLAISLEMSAKALGRRILAEASGIPVADLKRGQVGGRANDLTRARFELNGLPLQIEDAGGQPLVAIRQKARSAQRKFGSIALILVDHLQIVAPDETDRRNGATQAVGRISNGLRDIAKDFDTTVLCLSQLSRELLKRDDKRPNLGDLRQAGDIEQDADTVMFLHREEMFLSKSPPLKSASETLGRYDAKLQEWQDAHAQCAGKAELIFAKIRDGAPCTVPLRWHGETTSFSEEASAHKAPAQINLDAYADRFYEGGPPGGY